MKVKMVCNMNELNYAISGRMMEVARSGGNAIHDPVVVYYSRLMKRFYEAFHNARNYGFIGVGQITFAEKRMVIFQERLAKKGS